MATVAGEHPATVLVHAVFRPAFAGDYAGPVKLSRNMEALSTEEAEALLTRHQVGRLGCFSPSRNRAYVVPISYVYKQGALYFISLEGQKVRFLREHPAGICLEVDEVDDVRNWTSVVVTGHFEELTGEDRKAQQFEALFRATGGPLRFALADGDIYREPEAAVIWKLQIEELTGRRERWDFAEGFRYW